MVYSIIVQAEAIKERNEIFEYLIELGEDIVKKLVDSIDQLYERITTMPFAYPAVGGKSMYRKAVIEYKYIVLYRVDLLRNTVYIHHIVNSRQNWRKITK